MRDIYTNLGKIVLDIYVNVNLHLRLKRGKAMKSNERKHKAETRKERFTAMAGLIGTFGAGAFAGPKSTKLNLTMNAAEVTQMDLLIAQGLYPSREDFLQTATRNLLREHGVQVQQVAGQLTVAGIVMHSRKSLEKLCAAGKQLELNVTGIFRLSDDVTPELACAVIKSLKVCGAFQASAEVKAALKDRTR
jgi:Arc/MetJ-type ribon-helix-helix transcriptional regulator